VISLAGAPALAIGLLIWQRVSDPKLADTRTTGTSVGVAGALVMVAATMLAWPNPSGIVPVTLVDFAVLTAVAVAFRIPAAHLPALACLALGYVVGCHAIAGHVGWQIARGSQLMSALFSATTGNALVPMVALLAGAAALLRKKGRGEDGRHYLQAAAGLAAASLALATVFGFGRVGDPHGAMWVYALYASAALWLAARTGRAWLCWLGSALMLAALAQAMVFKFQVHDAWRTAFLAHAFTATVMACVRRPLARPMISTAMATAALATFVAWPIPAGIVHATLVDFAVLTATAMLFKAPVVHAVAAPFLVIACVTGCHAIAGRIGWQTADSAQLTNVLLSATTGNVLLPMAALLAAASAMLKRVGRNLEATRYGQVTVGVAAISLLLVTFHSFGRIGDPHGATWVYAIYAAAALWMAARTGRAAEYWLSSILLLAMFAQAFVFRFELHFGWRLALLAHASATAALAFAGRSLTQPMNWSALATSSLAALLIMDGVPLTTAAQSSAHTFWLSAVWLAVAFLRNSQALFTVFQVALSFAVTLAATALVEHRAWFMAMRHPWLDPWTLQTQGIALAALSGAWIALRLGFRRAFTILEPPWPTVDRVVTFALLVVTVVLAILGAWLGQEHALGAGSWLLLCTLVLVLLAGLWERFDPLNVLAIGLAPPIACLLLAGRWHAAYAMTDALRWWLAAYAVLASCLVWFRQQFRPLVQRVGWPDMESRSAGLEALARQQVLLLGVVPVIAMSLYTTVAWLMGGNPPVPAQESFFGRIGLSVSHAAPLGIISLILGGHALRERSGGCALSAGLALNLAVSAGYLLSLARGHISDVEWVRLAQLNAITFGGVALVWLAASAKNRGPSNLLGIQSWLAAGSNALLLAPAAIAIFLNPSSARTWVVETGNVSGWTALALALAAILWQRRTRQPSRGVSPNLAGPGLLALATLVACGACRWEHGQWLGYHTFLFAHATAAWAMLAIGARQRDRLSEFGRWALCLLGLTVVLALRAGGDDPGRPWWSVGAIVAMSALAATLAAQTQRRHCLYIAGPLLNLATTIWWLTEHPAGRLGDLLRINIIALAVPGLAWLAMELRVFRRSLPADADGGLPAFHRVAALGSVAAIAALVGAGLWADLAGHPLRADATLGWLALSATTLLVVGCLWDDNSRFVLPGLYALGLVAIGAMLDQLNLTPRRLLLAVVTNGGLYTLMTSIIWFERERWAALSQRLRMPPHVNPAAWLVPANLAMAAVVVTLGYWVVLTFPELKLRHFAALAALIQAPAVAVLAHGERRARLQQGALALGVISAVAWGWVWLQPGADGGLLHRAVVVMTVVAAMTALYGVGLAKLVPREDEWTAAARRMVQPLVIVGFGSLAFILVGEVVHQTTSGFVPMAWPAVVTVAVALVVACIECIAFAAIPGRDPFGLPERGRMAYVYAAEVLLALAFVHLRLTVPWLFQLHIFRRYWPVILMVIAFAGVGLGEIFKRQNRAVLSEPLERTGAFLPLLPVLGYWLLEPEIHFSVVLLMAAGLYGALSVARQSFGFGVLGAMAANGALWVWLHRIEGCGFLQHPQLWLIPAALSVLIAAYLNRDRLSAEQMTTIRYSATVAIYVASTADIFINGVAQAPWLPLVLAGLSVAGIFAGIALRVRAFLFPGAAFLVLAVLTVIWHAAVNLQQTWLWYVSGIVLGVLIIALFAVFEKKRNDILRLVDNLKQWEQ
jgi:hypothetical protein